MSASAANGSANGKRKREDAAAVGRDDRKAAPKERRLRQREQEMEEEFAATYHGPTALYKLLEVQHLHCPLFLPRTLSYRLVGAAATQRRGRDGDGGAGANGGDDGDAVAAPSSSAEPTGATLREFKIGMTAESIDHFKREGIRVGLLFAVYSAAADARKFAENTFELVATCLTLVPCVKEVKLPAALTRPGAPLAVVTVQVVRINDVVEQLSSASQYTFEPAATTTKPTLGKHLLRAAAAGGRELLFSNLLRVDFARRRAGLFSMELPAVAAAMRGVVKVQFRVGWDKPSRAAQMERLDKLVASKWPADFLDAKDDVSAELAVPKRVKPSPWTRRGGEDQGSGKTTTTTTKVWFHYLYHAMLRRMSERRPDFSCAWCNLYAGSLKGLVAHLVSSHSRFRFHVSAGHDNVPHIYVMPRSMPGANVLAAANAALCETHGGGDDDDKELDRIEHHFTFISPRKRGARTGGDGIHPAIDRVPYLDELDELEENAGVGNQAQDFYAPLLQRQYFHSRTGAVVLDHEKDYDSDDDVDEEWITQQSERLLDEFEDVSLEEKEFMKKWNRHVKENRILADFMVASSCRLFAKRHGKWLLDAGLRYNFLLHLFNLWDNSLLNSRAIIDCMLIVDHYAVLEETKAEDAHDAAKGAAANSAANGTANGTVSAAASGAAAATSAPASA